MSMNDTDLEVSIAEKIVLCCWVNALKQLEGAPVLEQQITRLG
jgi:hypothetical protein